MIDKDQSSRMRCVFVSKDKAEQKGKSFRWKADSRLMEIGHFEILSGRKGTCTHDKRLLSSTLLYSSSDNGTQQLLPCLVLFRSL